MVVLEGGGDGDNSSENEDSRGRPWGPWSIAEVYRRDDAPDGRRRKVLHGWAGNCLEHRDPAKPRLRCARMVTMGEDMSYGQCRRRVKEWLLLGLPYPCNERTLGHMKFPRSLRTQRDLIPGFTEEELDAWAAAIAAERIGRCFRCAHPHACPVFT